MAGNLELTAKLSPSLVKDLTTGNGPVAQYLLFVAGRAKANAIALSDDAVEHHTGNYQTSFTTTLTTGPGGVGSAEFRNTQPYALVIEKGMAPKQGDGLPASQTHNLLPISVRGKIVTFRMVRKPRGKPHPGIEARNVMEDAVRLAVNEPYTPGSR